MPEKEVDRREEMLVKCDEEAGGDGLVFDGSGNVIFYDGKIQPIYNAMDEYMKERCLEFIQWMLDKGVFATFVVGEETLLYYRGEYITKEQLFENFL